MPHATVPGHDRDVVRGPTEPAGLMGDSIFGDLLREAGVGSRGQGGASQTGHGATTTASYHVGSSNHAWAERYLLYPGYVIGWMVYRCVGMAVGAGLWTARTSLAVARGIYDRTVGAVLGLFWRLFLKVYESVVAPLFYFAAFAGVLGVLAGIVVGACAVAIQGAIPPVPPGDSARRRSSASSPGSALSAAGSDGLDPMLVYSDLDEPPVIAAATPRGHISPLASPKGLPAVLTAATYDKKPALAGRHLDLDVLRERGVLFPYEDEDGYFDHSSPERRASLSNDSSPLSSACGPIAEEDEDMTE